MHKVILVDDHYIVRQGLEFLLSTVDDLSVLKGFKRWRNIFILFKTMKDRTSCF